MQWRVIASRKLLSDASRRHGNRIFKRRQLSLEDLLHWTLRFTEQEIERDESFQSQANEERRFSRSTREERRSSNRGEPGLPDMPGLNDDDLEKAEDSLPRLMKAATYSKDVEIEFKRAN